MSKLKPINIKDVPETLLKKRDITESNFIFCLYKDPLLISDYDHIQNNFDIITEDGKFYYDLAIRLADNGYKVFDAATIATYLEDKKELKREYEKRCGFGAIKEITDVISEENIEAYYDDLVKNNLMIRLAQAGFNLVPLMKKVDVDKISAEDVYAFYEHELADISVGQIEKITVDNLSVGYEEYFDEWDKGNEIGFRIGSPMLNSMLLGIHLKNLILHLSGIGFGKTSSAIAWYVLPVLATQDVCILANEQDANEWRRMIIATVMFNKLSGGVEGMNRAKLIKGGFTAEQREKMNEAAAWLASQPGKIKFVDLPSYDAATIKKVIKRQAMEGTELFIVDTLKPPDDSSERAWGEFSEIAKDLFLLAKKLNIAVIATCQLSPDAMARRYLDLTCVGKSRQIAETAGTVVMFRPLSKEERSKVKPFKYEEGGKIRRQIELDPNKDYIMVFVPKNRYGQVTPQIIMERNMSFNSYKDIGWYECEYDQFKNK